MGRQINNVPPFKQDHLRTKMLIGSKSWIRCSRRRHHRHDIVLIDNPRQRQEIQSPYAISGRKSWLSKRHHANDFHPVFNHVDRQNGRNSSSKGVPGQIRFVTGFQIGFHILVYCSSGEIETSMHWNVDLAVVAHRDVQILGKIPAVGRSAYRNKLRVGLVISFQKIPDISLAWSADPYR